MQFTRNIPTTLSLFFLALFLSSCATTDAKWLHEKDGNEFQVSSGRANQERFVSIDNSLRTWNGALMGGEDKVPERKTFLKNMAEEEAKRVCGDTNFERVNEPSFGMMDKDPMTFGGGLLGVLIAKAASSYDNLPVSINYKFKCKDDAIDEGELKARG
jgi:hypothetical protein